MESDRSHIGVTDTAAFVREDYMAHGLQLNYLGKRRLTHLTAEIVDGSHVSNVSSSPVISHATALPFFTLKSKADRYLTYIPCNYINHQPLQ
jgi:hypothetical protein